MVGETVKERKVPPPPDSQLTLARSDADDVVTERRTDGPAIYIYI